MFALETYYSSHKMNILLAAFVLCVSSRVAQSRSVEAEADGKVIYCYFSSWTVYRPDNGKFDIEDINATLCTHVAYTFLGLNGDGTIRILDPWQNSPDGFDGFEKVVDLKEQNPNLKALISMGGLGDSSATYSLVASEATTRAIMVQQVMAIIEKYGFDGFALDWMYPGRGDTDNPADKQNFVLILQDLKAVMQPKGLILAAFVDAVKAYVDISYNVSALSEVLDLINLMSFNFHGFVDGYVGHHTPLYAATEDVLYGLPDWNIDASIKYWISSGADPAKLNLGLATYANTFTLQDASNTSLYANISGGGTVGPYTRTEGILGDNELCEFHPGVADIWNDEQKVPHKVIDDQWIGYENTQSIGIKVDYALEQQLGGFMVWSLDTDDFRGLCGNGTYPLVNVVHKVLTENGYKLKINH